MMNMRPSGSPSQYSNRVSQFQGKARLDAEAAARRAAATAKENARATALRVLANGSPTDPLEVQACLRELNAVGFRPLVDWYLFLGYPDGNRLRNAPNSEVKLRFRKFARLLHPDKHKGEEGPEGGTGFDLLSWMSW